MTNCIRQTVLQSAAIGALLLAPVLALAQEVEQTEIDWQTNATEYRGMYSRSYSVYCPPGGSRGSAVWGSGIYTDDSAVCIAAVHALATFDFARGGTVYFAMEPGQEGYDSERRRGVTTQPYNSWDGSFRIVAGVPGKRASEITANTPAEITWFTTAKQLRGNVGASHPLLCPRNGELRRVWGSDIYNDDSSICSAAVHAGLITRVSGGGVALKDEPAREGYAGTRRNSVTSLPWERGEGSFAFPKGQIVAALPPSTDAEPPEPARARAQVVAERVPIKRNASGELIFDWRSTASEWRGQNGSVQSVYCPAGGTAATVWGSGVYTDDSSVCAAAVHALSTFSYEKGGTVFFELMPGRESYASTSRRGVTTSEWGAWEASFRIVSGAPGKHLMDLSDTTEIEISWTTTAQQLLNGRMGVRRLVCPRDGVAQPVWGTDRYSDNSSICSAAVHARRITRADGGQVRAHLASGRSEHLGSTRAGITSLSLGLAERGWFIFPK